MRDVHHWYVRSAIQSTRIPMIRKLIPSFRGAPQPTPASAMSLVKPPTRQVKTTCKEDQCHLSTEELAHTGYTQAHLNPISLKLISIYSHQTRKHGNRTRSFPEFHEDGLCLQGDRSHSALCDSFTPKASPKRAKTCHDSLPWRRARHG